MNAPPDEIMTTPETDAYGVGPGERLRQARVAANLSIEEVSARMHLDRRTLELLEADDFAQLPAPTFVRGYLRGYARLLNLPPGPIIEAFDRRGFAPPALIADIATHAETRSTDLWVVAVTVVLLGILIALGAVWFQTQRGGDFEVVDAPTTDAPTGTAENDPPLLTGPTGDGSTFTTVLRPAETAVASGSNVGDNADDGAGDGAARGLAGTTDAGTSATGPDRGTSETPPLASTGSEDAAPTAGSTAQALQPDVAAAADGTNEGTTTAPSTDASTTTPGTTADSGVSTNAEASSGTTDTTVSPPVSESAIDTVVIRFSREAWVSLSDADGKKLFYNLGKPGRRVRVEGKRPITAVLGRVKGIQIEYNGRPFDFSPYISKGVARFEFRP